MEQKSELLKPLQPFIKTINYKHNLLERHSSTILYRKSSYLFNSFVKDTMIYTVETIKTNRITGKQTQKSFVTEDFKEALKYYTK